jgi:adenine-specific DNA methylase
MIPKECKRLAEVDFPIAVVSKHGAREKSIRHGHPSTLHLWWARRPLAACRAMLLGLLLPDPCDERCPGDFKAKARELLPKVVGSVGTKDEDLRRALLKFIGDFANWDLSAHALWLEVGRGLVEAAHPEETPLVVDPFAGGAWCAPGSTCATCRRRSPEGRWLGRNGGEASAKAGGSRCGSSTIVWKCSASASCSRR